LYPALPIRVIALSGTGQISKNLNESPAAKPLERDDHKEIPTRENSPASSFAGIRGSRFRRIYREYRNDNHPALRQNNLNEQTSPSAVLWGRTFKPKARSAVVN